MKFYILRELTFLPLGIKEDPPLWAFDEGWILSIKFLKLILNDNFHKAEIEIFV